MDAHLPAGPLAVAGDAAGRLRDALAGRRPVPLFVTHLAIGDAAEIARLAAGPAAAHLMLRPLYIHPPQATPAAAAGAAVRP